MNEKRYNVDGLRKFELEQTGVVYYIRDPNAEDIRLADFEYSKTYTKSLTEDITTSAEMIDILTRRGIIGPEFDKRADELQSILDKKVEELNNLSEDVSPEDRLSLAIEVEQARDALFNWNQRRSVPLSNTCESIADESRLVFLTSRLVLDDNGKQVWNTLDEYLKERNQELSGRAKFEVMLYLNGHDSDVLEQMPEAVAMRQVQDEMLKSSSEDIIQETSEVKEEDLEDKPKKRGRKKSN